MDPVRPPAHNAHARDDAEPPFDHMAALDGVVLTLPCPPNRIGALDGVVPTMASNWTWHTDWGAWMGARGTTLTLVHTQAQARAIIQSMRAPLHTHMHAHTHACKHTEKGLLTSSAGGATSAAAQRKCGRQARASASGKRLSMASTMGSASVLHDAAAHTCFLRTPCVAMQSNPPPLPRLPLAPPVQSQSEQKALILLFGMLQERVCVCETR